MYDSSVIDTNSGIRTIYWDCGNDVYIPGGLDVAAFAAGLRGDGFEISYNHDDASSDKLDAATDATVLNSSDHYLTLSTNEVAVVTGAFMGLASVSDVAHIEIGRWSGAAASDFVALTPEFDFHTGAAQSAADTKVINFVTPVVCKGTVDSKLGFRIERNDGTASAVANACGFIMKDLVLHTST